LFKIPVPLVFGNPRGKGDQLYPPPDTVIGPPDNRLMIARKLLPLGRNSQKMKILKVGTKLKYSP
jgi:hypothetical protein